MAKRWTHSSCSLRVRMKRSETPLPSGSLIKGGEVSQAVLTEKGTSPESGCLPSSRPWALTVYRLRATAYRGPEDLGR